MLYVHARVIGADKPVTSETLPILFERASKRWIRRDSIVQVPSDVYSHVG